eukprot:CAMPEP_0177396136 /NCGR_PEP_ID=MMETSP0368-20130122/56538_1 /TAXON_ID=447022 ORGANISM="Scrippsiella hangoei-like, Strain SHHI-4" /NCGR_SAMPLE_ID=MMETSP0368 /ASSEMBLY_ACC=CAM_ASM_000363 /LENGTH=115 /DNA_ID=CAMNT_0018862795 /DNA_START=2012 /DNA_END=2356 /DNA_ORIENTATION=-
MPRVHTRIHRVEPVDDLLQLCLLASVQGPGAARLRDAVRRGDEVDLLELSGPVLNEGKHLGGRAQGDDLAIQLHVRPRRPVASGGSPAVRCVPSETLLPLCLMSSVWLRSPAAAT